MKTIYSTLSILLLFILSSCQKDEQVFEDQLLVGTELIEAVMSGGQYQFDVLSNRDMTIETDVDWIELDSAFLAKGKHKAGFSVQKNADDERTGIITIRLNEEFTKQILVAQESGKIPVFFVSPSGTGDGSSWEEATNFASAMNQATSGSVLYLMQGRYTPTATIRNGETTEWSDRTFEISKNVEIIGGYSGEGDPDEQPNMEEYPTVLDGRLANGKQAFHTVTISAPKEADMRVTLRNLQVTGGHATDRSTVIRVNGLAFSRGEGGGITIVGSRVYMEQVEVIENEASSAGGTAGFAAGLYAFGGADIHLENCRVNHNRNLNNNGGGAWIHESTLTAFESEFNHNYARGTAGGVHGYPDAKIVLYNSEVSYNSNTSFGAGLYMRQGSQAIVVNSLLIGNTSTSPNGGGAVMLYAGSQADIISSTISANEIAGPGGGVFRQSGVNPLVVVNSVISGNKQASGSTDVDAHADNQSHSPDLNNSAIGTVIYAEGGAAVSGVKFNASTMLSPEYLLVGEENPARSYGLDKEGLARLSQTYTPALDERIEQDKKGHAREEKVMGALVE